MEEEEHGQIGKIVIILDKSGVLVQNLVYRLVLTCKSQNNLKLEVRAGFSYTIYIVPCDLYNVVVDY